MLDTTNNTALASGYLAHNRLPLAERVRVALGLLHGEVKGDIIAQALQQASPEEQTAFAREIGSEALWNILITAL
jgi:hypothetical protein